ncbi:PKD domain-containing protein [Nafulsella turpanensis]|uniref:PKD domain-containing protein n=1 Tax=Nafulsella turpanensis TaxID=1265690 RepID=UPI00034AE0E3|nr:T9SS type A sorting domain-containing protein [Nafulsella turpanensis]
MRKVHLFLSLLIGLFGTGLLEAQTVKPVSYYPMLEWDTSPYKSYRYTRENTSWDYINFRLLFPNGYDSTANNGKKYPLIIVLHGGGESALMEWNNSTKTNTLYPEGDPRRENNDHQLFYGGRQHLEAVRSGRFPGFVLFPQNFYGTWINDNGEPTTETYKDLQKTLELIDFLVQKLKIDPSRIYIQGLSNGGGGTWHAIYKRPDLFAAALPMSHRGHPAMAETIKHIPLWVFQGALDENPSPDATRKTVKAIEDAGGNVRYTEYDSVGHNTWNRAYNEPDFFEWMLAQVKSKTTNYAPEVSAGSDKVLTLPNNSTTFTASASDADGTVEAFNWEQVEGPAASLSGANTQSLSVSNLTQGMYEFRVTIKDDDGLAASDEVRLMVNSPTEENQPPTVSVSSDTSITLPSDTVRLLATASDEDGTIASYQWTKVSGPLVTMTNANAPELSLSELEEGQYTFQIMVADEKGAMATDELRLTVNSIPTGIEDKGFGALREVTFFPNPFSRELNLNVQVNQRDVYHLSVYNVQGQLIHQEKVEITPPGLEQYRINIPAAVYTKGSYFIRLQAEKGDYSRIFMLIKK